MNCAQVNEQLIDYLYGELPATARDAFTEHLRGCPACKSEVASYQSTLGSARTALGGPLLEEVPARVHLAVIEAAQAAAKQATRAKAMVPAARDELGFFARLWRTPWFLPAFGAASIATVVFLVRVIKNPEVLPGQRPHSIDERSLSSPPPVPAPEPGMPAAVPNAEFEAKSDLNLDEAKGNASAGSAHSRIGAKVGKARAQASGPSGGDRPKASETREGMGGLRLDRGGAGAGSQRQFAEPPPLRSAGKKSSRDVDDLLGGLQDGETLPARKALPPAPAVEMARPAAAPAPRVMHDYPGESAASAPAPAAPPTLRRKEMNRAAEEVEDSATADYDDVAKDKKAKGGDKPGTSLDESVRKAERLYTSQDWNAASAAYRDLLRRFPSHKDVPRWRDRMNESNVAYQRTLEAKRKKATTDDPLSGSKM